MTAPGLTDIQRKAALKSHPPVPAQCMVTGGSGFIGQRLVEMLVERGAQRVISFDILPAPQGAWQDPRIQYVQGDIRNLQDVLNAARGVECVWNLAAAVGPYHPTELYQAVNYGGTANVLEACRQLKVPKMVQSTSPSTRFTGEDVDGLGEADLPAIPLERYMADYAATKAEAEILVTKACCDQLLTINIAPHQVYGPRDTLFLPNMLDTAGTGKLRVFGEGQNRVSFTLVDNYCHALCIAERTLYQGSPTLGKFYVCTDAESQRYPDGYCFFWEEVDRAIIGMGFQSIRAKSHLPYWFIMGIARICDCIGYMIGKKLKLSAFAVKALVMHRWFKPDLAAAELGYHPIIPFDEGWEDTIAWFRENWLPTFHEARHKASGWTSLNSQTQQKIDGQSAPLGKSAV